MALAVRMARQNIWRRRTGRQSQGSPVSSSFSFPFSHHLPYIVHLDILLFILRVIFVDLRGMPLSRRLQETSVPSCEIGQKSSSDDRDWTTLVGVPRQIRCHSPKE